MLLSVHGVGLKHNLAAFQDNLFVLHLIHYVLKVVVIQADPSEVAVPLSRRIGLNDHSAWLAYWDVYILLKASEVELLCQSVIR